MNLPELNRPDLLYQHKTPLPVEDLSLEGSILQKISTKDYLINAPYQSFSYLIKFLREAAQEEIAYIQDIQKNNSMDTKPEIMYKNKVIFENLMLLLNDYHSRYGPIEEHYRYNVASKPPVLTVAELKERQAKQ
jgi:hypothetical protein